MPTYSDVYQRGGVPGVAPPADVNDGRVYNGFRAFFVDGMVLDPLRAMVSPQGLLALGLGAGATAVLGTGILPLFALAGLAASGWQGVAGLSHLTQAKTAKDRYQALRTLGSSVSGGIGSLLGLKPTARAANIPGAEPVMLNRRPGWYVRSSLQDARETVRPHTLRALVHEMEATAREFPSRWRTFWQQPGWRGHLREFFQRPGETLRRSADHTRAEAAEMGVSLQEKAARLRGRFAGQTEAGETKHFFNQRPSRTPPEGQTAHGDPWTGDFPEGGQVPPDGWRERTEATLRRGAASLDSARRSGGGTRQLMAQLGRRSRLVVEEARTPDGQTVPGQGPLDALRSFLENPEWRHDSILKRPRQPVPTQLAEDLDRLARSVGTLPKDAQGFARLAADEARALAAGQQHGVKGFMGLWTDRGEATRRVSTQAKDYLLNVRLPKGAQVIAPTLVDAGADAQVFLPRHGRLKIERINHRSRVVEASMVPTSVEERLAWHLNHMIPRQGLTTSRLRTLAKDDPRAFHDLIAHGEGTLVGDLMAYTKKHPGAKNGLETYYVGLPSGVDKSALVSGRGRFSDAAPLVLTKQEAAARAAAGNMSEGGLLMKLTVEENTPLLTREQLRTLGVKDFQHDALLSPLAVLDLKQFSDKGIAQFRVVPKTLARSGATSRLPVDPRAAEQEGYGIPNPLYLRRDPIRWTWHHRLRDPYNRLMAQANGTLDATLWAPLRRIGVGDGQWGKDLSRATFELGLLTGMGRGALDVARGINNGGFRSPFHQVAGQGVAQGATMGLMGTGGGIGGSYLGASIGRAWGQYRTKESMDHAIFMGQTVGGLAGGLGGTLLGTQVARLPLIQWAGGTVVSGVLGVPFLIGKGVLGLLGIGVGTAAGGTLGVGRFVGGATRSALG